MNIKYPEIQEYRYAGSATTVKNPPLHRDTTEQTVSRQADGGMLPFLSLLYILNGNHDPRKVQWLNVCLAAAFLLAGFFVGWDLYSVALVFVGIALVNAANCWVLRRFGRRRIYPGRGDLLSQIEFWSRRGVKSRQHLN